MILFQTNTMQLVLASDGHKTFVMYNYLDINWPNTESTQAEKALVNVAEFNNI